MVTLQLFSERLAVTYPAQHLLIITYCHIQSMLDTKRSSAVLEAVDDNPLLMPPEVAPPPKKHYGPGKKNSEHKPS